MLVTACDRLLMYCHPTQVVIVDDHEMFLEGIGDLAPPQSLIKLFADPILALEYINDEANSNSVDFSTELVAEEEIARASIDLTTIGGLIADVERFSQVSVVICDYAMLGVNGLEVLASINSPLIKRVLLTGVADEKLAVQAFNSKSIDRFVMKGTTDLVENLFAFAEELQLEFLRDGQRSMLHILSEHIPEVLHPSCIRCVHSIFSEYSVCEYYFCSDPMGFLALQVNGRPMFIHITNRWSELGSDVEVVESLPIEGWRVGIEKEPAVDIDFDPEIHGFKGFTRLREF